MYHDSSYWDGRKKQGSDVDWWVAAAGAVPRGANAAARKRAAVRKRRCTQLRARPPLAPTHRHCSYQTLRPLCALGEKTVRGFAALVLGSGASTFPEELYDG